MKFRFSAIALVILATFPLMTGRAATPCAPRVTEHDIASHASTRGHARECGMEAADSVQVTKQGGLGSIDIKGKVAAVVERDEGTVALVDLGKMRVIGRYEDDVQDSLDGDVAFSDDGDWVFYARQTSDFDEDGVHVLDVTDRSQPNRTMYLPGGGSYRLEYYQDDAGEYVVVLDAIDGLTVNRFVRESGSLVRVFQDAAPALKVGGPASAGVFIVRKDPISGTPLMYVTTGQTGLQVYDMTDPTAPQIVGEWSDVGLADVKVRTRNGRRLVYAATEYWFDKTIPPAVVVLDATKLDAIEKVGERKIKVPVDDTWRAQGLVVRPRLFVAYSHAGLIEFNRRGRLRGVAAIPTSVNEPAGYQSTPYVMDVAVRRGMLYITDAASGRLTRIRPDDPSPATIDGGRAGR